eukprot:g6053.t1
MSSSGQLSLVPVGDALAVKEGLSLESAVATLRKLDGRDKATKMMQYGARFFYWWFATTDPALSQRAFKLYRTTQRSRKAFRMLKVLDEVVKLRQILRTAGGSKADFLGYKEALASLRCLAMGTFWTFDNLNYLTTAEMVNFGVTEKKRREVLAEYAAAVSRREGLSTRNCHRNENDHGNGSSSSTTTSNCSGSGVIPQQRQEESRRAAEAEGRLREALSRANAEHFKSWLMVLKGALDLTCAVNITGMDLPKRLLGRKLNDGVIGAVGCASALCVLYNSWPARKHQQQHQQVEQDQRQGQRPSNSDSLLPAPAPSPPPP